jgi:hypothetical protein
LLLATDSKEIPPGNGQQRRRLHVLKKIWDRAKDNLTTHEIKMSLATDNKGNTAWHWAAENGELDLLQVIWNRAKMNLITEVITLIF